MNEPKSVAVWIRVSTEDQKQGDSPEHHEERGRMYAKMKGWEVVTVYHLEAFSGKTVMGHPETRRMLNDIKSGAITGLIFSKLARFARNTKELLEFADIFKKYDADLISLQESIDTSTPAGRFFYTLLAAMAQWEREEISSRVAASVPIRAKLGKPLGGAAPYGYKWEDKKLVLNEEEAPIRKQMYSLFLSLKRIGAVAKELNNQGYRTRKGAKFTRTTVTRLLRDPVAKGLRRANYTQSLGEGKHWVTKPEEDWVFTKVPALISEELWDKCKFILDEQAQKSKRRERRTKHLFAGFVICQCGSKMYVPWRSKKYTCQKCRSKIEAVVLEDVFHDQLANFIFSDEQISGHLNKTEGKIKEKEQLLFNLKSRVGKTQTQLNNLIELYQQGEIPKEGFRHHYTPLFEQMEKMKKQIPKFQAEIDHFRVQMASSDQILHEARILHEQWRSLAFENKRTIIETVLKNMIIEDDGIQINLAYLPTMAPLASSRTLLETIVKEEHNHKDS